MMLTADRQRVKTLLTETITLLCKNGLHFKTEFSIEALIGITLDDDDVFLVSINETIRPASSSLTSSDRGQLEMDRRNSADQNVSSGQQDYNRSTEFGYNDSDDLLQRKTKSCSGKSSLHDNQRNVSEILRRSPKRSGQDNLKPNIKRRFSESNDSNLKPADCEDASVACNSSDARMNSDLAVLPTSSIFNANYASAEQFSKRSRDDSRDREGGNSAEVNSNEQLSTDSCEIVDVKVEPGSEDDSRLLSANERSNGGDMNSTDVNAKSYSSGSGFPKPSSYLVWNDYAQFSQHEFITSVKPKEQHSAGLITHHQSDEQLDQRVSHHHQRHLPMTIRQRQRNRETTNLGRSQSQTVQGVPACNYRYECPYCGKRFAATNNLRGHLVKHTGIKEFVCQLCGNQYAFKQKLKYHLNVVHQLQI